MSLTYFLLKWLSSCIRAQCQRLEMEGVLSSPTEIQSGLSQGSILAPFFCHVCNNLPSSIHLTRLILYADDTVLYYTAKSTAELD